MISYRNNALKRSATAPDIIEFFTVFATPSWMVTDGKMEEVVEALDDCPPINLISDGTVF